jgi:DNA-binding NarL/FixJ family response regulator
MIRILIADDHAVVRKGLKQIISETGDMYIAEETDNGFDVLNRISENQYDLVLLDISMPGRNGMDILKQLKRIKPKLPVLMLSVHPEEQYAVRAIKAGASGYLTKKSAPDELIAAIRSISKGKKFVSASIAERLIYELEADVEKPNHGILSDREYQVMCLFGMGKKLNEIASELCLSVQSISTYRSRILDKMRMNTTAEIIRYAIKNGLVE